MLISAQNEEENAIKEITQDIALLSLSRVDFFKVAEFHGGTALRILHSLQRYSEDLDFALLTPDQNFDFNYYLKKMHAEFESFGYEVEIKDRSKTDSNIKKVFLKQNSIGKLLSLSYPIHEKNQRKINIKLEVDINPPIGANTELKYLDFPLPYSVLAKDLPSLFAGKIHALLARSYIKGRDWYDFIWYTSKKTPVNFGFLQNAIDQIGPWENQKLTINQAWLTNALSEKIETIDWSLAAKDVERFIRPIEKDSLKLWSVSFFQDRLKVFEDYLSQ